VASTSPRVRCPTCGKRFRADAARVAAAPRGLRSRCTGCGASFRVLARAEGPVAEPVLPGLNAPAPSERRRRRAARAARDAAAGPDGTAASALGAGERIGRYEIEALLGRGGMGAVYRVYDPATNRHVALKVLAPDAPEDDRRRFRREVEIQGNVHHPHLMPIYDSGVLGTTRWYTMEFLDRPLDLTAVLALSRGEGGDAEVRLRPLTSIEGVLRHVLVPVCEAIHHANAREGVLHRDLKPANVLVDRNGLRPFVIDFGVGSVLERTNDRLAHLPREVPVPASGRLRVTGTLGWMPPEQARGETDRRGDVWGLGALVRFVATGEPPYRPAARSGVASADRADGLRLLIEQAERRGDAREVREYRETLGRLEATGDRSTKDLARDVLAARYVPMPTDVDRGLAAVVARAMAPDPAERYRHALELRDDLLAWLSHRPLRAILETTGAARGALYRGALLVRRRRGLVALGAVAVLGGAVALAWGTGHATAKGTGRGDVRQGADEALAAARRAVERERTDALVDEARRLAADADLRLAAGDVVAGDRALARLGHALDGLGADTLPAEELDDLRRRARGEMPFVVRAPWEGCRLSLVPVASGGGRVAWDAERPVAETVPRGRWILRVRRGDGEVLVPFEAAGADHPVEVACPVDPATLDASTVYVPGGRAPGPGEPSDVGPLLWDRTEATEERYARFLASLPASEARRRAPRAAGVLGGPDRPLWTERDGVLVPPTTAGRRPVEGISLHDARAFARFEGQRLPTAAEWAWAASGPDGRLTPVGDLADLLALRVRAGTGGAPGDVGGEPADRSPFGLLDLSGNVAEWTSTHAAYRGVTGWFAMGGGYAADPAAAVVVRADPRPGWAPAEGVGVRLVRDVPR
jgi:serine/threonine protein kinase